MLIQTEDTGRKLQRKYKLEGPNPSPLLGIEVIPVVVVDDIAKSTDPASQNFPRPVGGTADLTPAATQFAEIALLNPANSGIIITVREIKFSAPASSLIALVLLDGPTAGSTLALTEFFLDSRVSGDAVGELRRTSLLLPQLLTTIYAQRGLGNTVWTYDEPIILMPQGHPQNIQNVSSVGVAQFTSDVQVHASMVWDERPL